MSAGEGGRHGHKEPLGVVAHFAADQLLHFYMEIVYHFVYSLPFPQYFDPSGIAQLHLSLLVDLNKILLGALFIPIDESVQLPLGDSLIDLLPALLCPKSDILRLLGPRCENVVQLETVLSTELSEHLVFLVATHLQLTP